jgi:Tol biopolymer transport system component
MSNDVEIGMVLMLALALAIQNAALSSDLMAQGESGIPSPLELVAEGVVSTDGGEAFPSSTPGGNRLYFATHQRGWTGFHIVVSHLVEGKWTAPSSATFNSSYNDRAPFVSPDGSMLFFSSDRPLPDAVSNRAGSFNVWFVTRSSSGDWSDPRPVTGVNSRADDFHAAVSAGGTLYFSSNRPGGYGQYDLYRAEPEGDGYAAPVNLGPTINTAGEETDVYVSPDESYLIVVATERAGGFGGDDLWLSVRRNGAWEDLVNLGEPVNSSSYEYGPFVSTNGRFLYFTTHRRGLGDIVRVPTGLVPALTSGENRSVEGGRHTAPPRECCA